MTVSSYEHNIRRSSVVSPYFNALCVILVFDFTNGDTFGNLMNWYNETLRYCNFKTLGYLVVGCNKGDNTPITDEDVNGFIDFFPGPVKPAFVVFDEDDPHPVDLAFRELNRKLVDTNFPKEFLDTCPPPRKNSIPSMVVLQGRGDAPPPADPEPTDTTRLLEEPVSEQKPQDDLLFQNPKKKRSVCVVC